MRTIVIYIYIYIYISFSESSAEKVLHITQNTLRSFLREEIFLFNCISVLFIRSYVTLHAAVHRSSMSEWVLSGRVHSLPRSSGLCPSDKLSVSEFFFLAVTSI